MTIASLPQRGARSVPVATVEQMSRADRFAADSLRIPLDTLMENASRQVAAAVLAFAGTISGKDVVVLAGKGNNGGDALGALPHLREAGAVVEAYVTAPRDSLGVLPGIRYDELTKAGIHVRDSEAIDERALVRRLTHADIVIDGLLGYSARGQPRGEVARLITVTTAAEGHEKVVAVDVPSGLDADVGTRALDRESGILAAAVTVTLALPKPGLLAKAARPFVGELLLADIGIPPEAFRSVGIDDTRGIFARGPLLRLTF